MSTPGQATEDKISIPLQVEKCRKLILENGWQLVKTYVDPGYTSNTLNRPALQKLLKELPAVDVLVCYDPDRLSRDNPIVEATIFNELDRHRKQCTSVTQPIRVVGPEEYDPMENDTVFIQRRISGLSGGLDNRRRRRRLMAGVKAKMEEGHLMKPRPYGYSVEYTQVRKDGRPTFEKKTVVVRSEAEVVRRIFREYIEGVSARRIAEDLNKDNIPSKTGRLWLDSVVQDLLKNPVYCGKVRMSVTPIKDGKRARIPSDRWTIVDGKHESIIDEDTFRKAEVVCRRKRKWRRAIASPKLLSGLVRCGFCGWSMISGGAYRGGRYGKYCCGKHRSTGHCQRNAIPTAELEKGVLREIEGLLNDPALLAEVERIKQVEETETLQREVRQLRKKLKEYPVRKARLLDLYETAALSRLEFVERKELQEDEEQQFRDNLQQIEGLLEKVSQKMITLKMMKQALQEFSNNQEHYDPQKRKQKLANLVENITVRSGAFKVNFRFSQISE